MYRIISYAAAALLTVGSGATPAFAGGVDTCKASNMSDYDSLVTG